MKISELAEKITRWQLVDFLNFQNKNDADKQIEIDLLYGYATGNKLSPNNYYSDKEIRFLAYLKLYYYHYMMLELGKEIQIDLPITDPKDIIEIFNELF